MEKMIVFKLKAKTGSYTRKEAGSKRGVNIKYFPGSQYELPESQFRLHLGQFQKIREYEVEKEVVNSTNDSNQSDSDRAAPKYDKKGQAIK